MTTSGAAPAPKKPDPESDLDVVINRIDKSLPVIHRMCRARKKQKRSPTSRLPARAQAAFEEMRDNPIVIDEGEVVPDAPVVKINGFHKPETES